MKKIIKTIQILTIGLAISHQALALEKVKSDITRDFMGGMGPDHGGWGPGGGQFDGRFGFDIQQLTFRVNQLESQNADLMRRVQYLETLESRIANLERVLGNNQQERDRTPYPGSEVSCLIIDSGYSKTFLGKGRNSLEAEAAARTACGNTISSSYCGTPVRCSDTESHTQYSRGSYCMMTDTGYGKTFQGEGRTFIEAEAKAKQTCEGQVSASYCGNARVRCQDIQ